MSNTLSNLPDSLSATTRLGALPEWLREPLLHFVLLGGLLFFVDHLAVGKAADPHLIVVGADVDYEAVELFKSSRGREPNAQERQALHQVYLDNEVLYREGLAMQLDRGDAAIRERVIFKALSVVDASVKLPVADDKVLSEWFEKHRIKYDEPARYDFEEAVLSGDSSEAAVRAFVHQLNFGMSGNAKAGLRVFKGRPVANIVQSYGAEFSSELASSTVGEWQALKARDGWRAMRLNAITAAKPAMFAMVRNLVMQDWKDEVAAEQRTAAVRALARKYQVKYEKPIFEDQE